MAVVTLEGQCVEFIGPEEGCVLTAYQDIAGVWTIGYGHTVGVNEGQVWTQVIADNQFAVDLHVYVMAVVSANRYHPITDQQIVAMTSLCYNIGVKAFKSSSVLALHNQGNFKAAASAFLLWDKAHVNGVLEEVEGLLARREAEAALYLKGVPNA